MDLQDGLVFHPLIRLGSLDCLVQVRIERFPFGLYRFQPGPLQHIQQALVDQLHTFGPLAIRCFGLEGAFKIIQDGEQLPYQLHAGILDEFRPVAFRAAAEVLEIGLAAQQLIAKLGLVGRELVPLGPYSLQFLGEIDSRDCRLGEGRLEILIVVTHHFQFNSPDLKDLRTDRS